MCRALWCAVGVLIAAAAASAQVKVERVEYSHDGVTLRGFLAFDEKSQGKRPGVLVCHEWWGCNDHAKAQAERLAGEGYVAFALDMYGEGKSVNTPQEAGQLAGALYADPAKARARAAAGLKVLAESPRVDSARLAAIGYCMGGTVALELARTGADLDAVVAFHTSTIAATNADDNKSIKGSVLICHGALDTFVKPEQIADFHAQMDAAKVDYQFISYAGAVHSFTNPAVDAFNIPGAKYDAKADRRSWGHMRSLFAEAFAQ